VLTPSALARIREVQTPGEADLLTEMAEAFLEAAPRHLADIVNALARADADAVADAAHALKGGAAYMGAHELQQVCLELETRGRSGQTAGSDALIDSLRSALALTRASLAAELARQNREPQAA
jgi:HPt (histidine-containing phosphotransfer) domain-containing protein